MTHSSTRARSRFGTRALFASAVLSLLPLALPALAQEYKPVTMATLLDRIQIEDLLTRYYYDLSMGKSHALADYFTPDALLDVDGTIAKGHKEIEKLYQRPEGVAAPESANNAAAQASFIPLLTLGIPPNAVMALMVGAMTIHGIIPGPQIGRAHV